MRGWKRAALAVVLVAACSDNSGQSGDASVDSSIPDGNANDAPLADAAPDASDATDAGDAGDGGCTGLCSQVPTCPPNTTTTLSGTVLDPAGNHPVYDAVVYVPNNANDPGLKPFAPGLTCDICGVTPAGDPLVMTRTAADGTFTLKGMPVGASIPVIAQSGRWRRQISVNVSVSCGANVVPAGTFTMPKNHTEGDIPRIAIVTGSFDPIECVLRKMGVQDSEFTDPGGGGAIQFYLADQSNAPANPFSDAGCPNPYGSGAKIDSATPAQSALFAAPDGGSPAIDQYDVVLLPSEGYEEDEQASWAALGAYTAAGGRALMINYAYDWIAKTLGSGANNVTQNPAYTSVATWDTQQNFGITQIASVDLVNNPKGMAFDQWLVNVGASVQGSHTISLYPVYRNSDAVTVPTQRWLYNGSAPIHFTFNTPLGAANVKQCGRVAFADWQPEGASFGSNYASCPVFVSQQGPYVSHGLTFPAECDTASMTASEAVLEFMLFDLGGCVQPYTPVCTPTTCSALGVWCGPTSDGCGNSIDCGTCPMGETCGGGGAGQCGTSTCAPQSCASQGIQCGPTGDGCGKAIECGNCPTGQICGLAGRGKCGAPG